MNDISRHINVVDLDNAIQMLKNYTNEDRIKPLIVALENLKDDPDNKALIAKLSETWQNLGIHQGAVLTYVPYFYTLIPDDIFGDDLKK